MTTTKTTETRETLDLLLAKADAALRKRDSIERCSSPEWRAAHQEARDAYAAAREERIRLWKADRYGLWMNKTDRAIALISGEIT